MCSAPMAFGILSCVQSDIAHHFSNSRLCDSTDNIRFHDLRHTFATLALQNGVDVKTVSSMLGHYDAGFTLRTYTHATRQMQQKAAEKMGSFMAQIR